MKPRSQFEYSLQQSINNMLQHKVMSLASIITTAACLLLISSMLAISLNISNNMKQFQVENAILAFVDDTYSESESRGLERDIAQLDNIKKITFISQEEAYNNYIEEYGNGGNETFLNAAVFRNRFAVEVNDVDRIAETSEEIQNIDGIADIRVDETVTRGFAAISRAVNMVGAGITVLLLIISVVIMTNTINLTVLSRHEEISVMKMMGAYNGFIRLPFLCEGCVVGACGALIAFILSIGVYQLLCGGLGTTGIMSLITMMPFTKVAQTLFTVDLIFGLGVGIAGCAVTIRKYLKD